MRRLAAAAILTLALAGCGPDRSPSLPDGLAGSPGASSTATPDAAPATPAPPRGPVLDCGAAPLAITYLPEGLREGPGFAKIKALTQPLDVRGLSWRAAGEELRVGVVCGIRSAGRFSTLVSRSYLDTHDGRPALRWRTRGDVRNYMWLERPGTAVYVAATPGLAREVAKVVAGITP
jgi:hypothetical protein